MVLTNGRSTQRNFLGQSAEVQAGLRAAALGVKGLAGALRQYANTKGIGGKLALADKRLTVQGGNEVGRALLGNDDIRAYLLARAILDKGAETGDVASLAAAAAGLLTISDRSTIKTKLKLANDPLPPWMTFFETLVAEVVKRENLDTSIVDATGKSVDITDDIVADLMADPPSLTRRAAIERIEDFISLAKSPAKAALKGWKGKGEIRQELIEQPGVEPAMLSYLDRLGVDFTGGRVGGTKFDEYFALAYEHATQGIGVVDDPIQAKLTGKITDWDFSVDPLDGIEQQQVIAKNIRAAGALDYVFQLGERLGAYKLCDALVLRWAHGSLDVPDGEAADKLYRYWKLRDERSAPEERGLLYRRILAKGPAQILSGMVVNEEFPVLWGNLMEQVVDFIDKSESTRLDERGPSKVRLARATKQLQYNLTEHMTGMAQVQTAEVYAQLRDALEILADSQIVAILAGGRRQNLWTVIERLTRDEFGISLNVEALRSVAVDGNRVFSWVADYMPGSEDTAAFEDFLDAAESYIVAEASVQNDNAEWLDEEEPQEEDDFEEFDDFESEFDELEDAEL